MDRHRPSPRLVCNETGVCHTCRHAPEPSIDSHRSVRYAISGLGCIVACQLGSSYPDRWRVEDVVDAAFLGLAWGVSAHEEGSSDCRVVPCAGRVGGLYSRRL